MVLLVAAVRHGDLWPDVSSILAVSQPYGRGICSKPTTGVVATNLRPDLAVWPLHHRTILTALRHSIFDQLTASQGIYLNYVSIHSQHVAAVYYLHAVDSNSNFSIILILHYLYHLSTRLFSAQHILHRGGATSSRYRLHRQHSLAHGIVAEHLR